jgi:peptidyl-prolyl cis-trans isomerase D
MLSQLRQSTKTILWIVIVAFVGLIFVVWGMNLRTSGGPEAGFVGKVAGERITLDEYRTEVSNQRAIHYEQSKQRGGPQVEQAIRELAWDTIVQNHLLWRAATSERLLATDDEVLIEIQTNPPPFIRSQPVFQTDSVFDQSKYLAALSDPRMDFRFLEAYIRATLPLRKLQDYVVSNIRVTDAEARTLLAMMQETVTISYLRIDPMTDVTEAPTEISQSDLSSYYSSHLEDFRIPEKRRLYYVEFPKQPSAEDERYAREKIEEAFDLITEGEPFPEIAAEYSDDESTAAQGGDMGWVRRGRLSGKLDSVAFALGNGEMSNIIKTQDGFHVLKAEETRQVDGVEERALRYILSRLEPSPLTIEETEREVAEFTSSARRKGIEKVAEEEAYQYSLTEDLVLGQVPITLMISPADAEGIFGIGTGEVIGPIEGVVSFYAVQVAEVIPSRIPALEEVQESARQSYVFSAKKNRARQIADSAVAQLSAGRSLEEVAGSTDLNINKAGPFSRMTGPPDIGAGNPVVAHAFMLGQSESSGVIEHDEKFYIVRVDERESLEQEDYESSLPSLRMSLLSTKQQAYLQDWYTVLKGEAEIEDYRSFGAGY